MFRRGNRTRSGRCPSSMASPTASCRASATSANRPAIPSEKRTVAYVPAATPGSPFSTLWRVIRLIDARCAKIATGMRRRRRALRISCPSFRRARVTGRGIRKDKLPFPITSIIIGVTLYNVYDCGPCINSTKTPKGRLAETPEPHEPVRYSEPTTSCSAIESNKCNGINAPAAVRARSSHLSAQRDLPTELRELTGGASIYALPYRGTD